MASNVSNAVGVQQLWGFSPSADLQDAWYLSPESGERGEAAGTGRAALGLGPGGGKAAAGEVHALLLGAADPRHVVHTLALAGRWPERPLRFYLLEETPEAVARQLLLLLVTLQRGKSVEVRAQLFLELLGNLRLRDKTAEALRDELVPALLRALDGGRDGALGGLLDLSHLKFKERDELEHVARRWARGEGASSLPALWDQRLRSYFGDRFDSREAVIDWDYRMRGIQRESPVLHSVHYRAWRTTGQAFELRECEYRAPNATLLTAREAVQRGRGPVRVVGYWGDTAVTPHVALGVESSEGRLFEVRQTMHTRTSVDVAEHNLGAMISEWQLGRARELPPCRAGRPRGVEGQGQDPDTEGREAADEPPPKEDAAAAAGLRRPEDTARVAPLPRDPARVFGRAKYRALFNRVFVAQTHAHLIGAPLSATLAPGAVVTVETLRHVPVTDEARAAYVEKVYELADAAGWTPCVTRGDGKAELPGRSAVRLSFTYTPAGAGEA